MKERPILFNAPMVRSVLSGVKRLTRRVMKPQPPIESCSIFSGRYHPTIIDRHGDEQPGRETYGAYTEDGEWAVRCPYGQPGDQLWVRETFGDHHRQMLRVYDTMYRADADQYGLIGLDEIDDCLLYVEDIRWKPSIHMPRTASRITLEITGVRVERVQEISEADAVAEGVERVVVGDGWRRYDSSSAIELAGLVPCETARASYRSLWEQINGPGSWEANPWVWVIKFKRVTP